MRWPPAIGTPRGRPLASTSDTVVIPPAARFSGAKGNCRVWTTWVKLGPLPERILKPTVAVVGVTGPCLMRKATITPDVGAWIVPLPPLVWTAVHTLVLHRPAALGSRLEPTIVEAPAAGAARRTSTTLETIAARHR